MLAAYLFTVFTSSGKESEVGVGVGREMEELGFSTTRFPSRKDFVVYFLLRIFFSEMFNIIRN